MYCDEIPPMRFLLEPKLKPTVGRKFIFKHLAVYWYKKNLIKFFRKLTYKSIIVIIVTCLIIIYFVYQRPITKYKLYTELMDETEWVQFKELNNNRNTNGVPKGYLVFSGGCQIPDYNPFSQQVMEYFKKQNYTECMPNKKPITRLVHNYENQSVHVIIDNNAKTEMYGSEPIFCCYYEITRGGINESADMKFNASVCNLFTQSIHLPMHIEYIIVKCNGTKVFDPIYVNMHFVVIKRADIEVRIRRLAKTKSKKKLSVLLIGIDSISRLNLIRAMPQTTQYLYNNDWFELMGYNKIGDNTFPNLMAILTGYNRSTAYDKCNPTIVGKLDTCPLIWKDFHDNGYVTAYAEDEAKITTFNYLKFGFKKQPTDYYMRPILLATEANLPITEKSGLTYCLGYTQYADYILDYGIDFARTFHNQPHFGLFWVNTFSHNALSDPSSMDLKIRNYLNELNVTGVLDESMVIFFSDHGMRFGPIRQMEIGWLEERLPFMFISLPKWFRMKYPGYVQSLHVNQNRLTNPYDIHMTLKHILEMSDPEYAMENINYSASACKQCQSIFHDVPINRSCSDANIQSHWCTCVKFESIDLLSSIIQNGIKYIIEYMNTVLLVNYLADSYVNDTGILDKGKSCAKLQLKEIKSARKGTMKHFHIIENYLVMYETTPGDGVFETTLSYEKSKNKFQITGSISRLNKYGDQSSCVKDVKAKKYCYCIDAPTQRLKSED